MASVLQSSSSCVLVVYQSVSDLCSPLHSSEILEPVLFYFCGPFPPQFLG
jgi:predicted  nucleic acid-binding Zn ribbon protein